MRSKCVVNNYSDPRQCDFYMPECCNNLQLVFFSTRRGL